MTFLLQSCQKDKAEAARKKYLVFVAEGIGGGSRVDYHNGNAEGLVLDDDHFARATRLLAGRAGTDSLIAERIEELRRELGIAGSPT